MTVILGTSYLVAHSSAGSYDPSDRDTWYRGWKDFLIYKQTPGPDPRVEVTRQLGNDLLTATLYSMGDLLEDPGSVAIGPVGGSGSPPITYTLDMPAANGLYRLRVEPATNLVAYSVEIFDVRYCALEAWEPRYNFYIWGQSGQAPPPAIVQYFFVPSLPAGEKVLARLETEKGVERAQLDIYTQTGTQSLATLKTWGTFADAEVGRKAYFDTGEIDFNKLGPLGPPGAVFRFALSLPVPDGSPPVNQQPSGNVWVRFGRQIPPYFANNPNRLMWPIVHRSFDFVRYTGADGSYRAHLCAPRGGSGGVPSGSELKVRIDTASDSTTVGYSAQVAYAAGTQKKLDAPDTNVLAQLFDGGAAIAKSTDKVDTAYFVPEPSWTEWPNPLYMIWDNSDGVFAPVLAQQGHYDTVRVDKTNHLVAIVNQGMTGVGALWDPAMNAHFNSDPNDSRMLFWQLRDEPDSGPGPEGPFTLLKTVYDDDYARKATPTSKPLGMTLQHPYAMQEFAQGCDVIMTDGLIRPAEGTSVKKVSEWANEGSRIGSSIGSGDTKRTIAVLWLWDPELGTLIATPADYEAQFRQLFSETQVDGVGGWNFANDTETNRLDQASPSLWAKIGELNGSNFEFIFNNPGWWMISVPVTPMRNDLSLLFPDAISAFIFAGAYQQVLELYSCKGYWMNNDGTGPYLIRGPAVSQCVMVHAPQGWSFIPCPIQPVLISSIGQNPPNSIISIFGWNGSAYVQLPLQTGELQPGQCYWVNLNQQATLTIPG